MVKITNGTCTTLCGAIFVGEKIVARMEGEPDGEGRCNEALIKEAFNVANETGLTPRELLEQRDELLVAARAMSNLYVDDVPTDHSDYSAVIKLRDVIAKAEGKQVIKFKDEKGNIVTPQRGDYVLASDIANEEKHNAVREAFGAAGCNTLPSFGGYGMGGCLNNVGWDIADNCFCWIVHQLHLKRRIIPIYQTKTLFEAAKDAPDGTVFKVLSGEKTAILMGGRLRFDVERGFDLPLYLLDSTDYELVEVPAGPVKCDNVPDGKLAEMNKARDLIKELMKWPGAQIGKPGWAMRPAAGFVGGDKSHYVACLTKVPYLPTVTFKTHSECIAAYRAECPELFE